MRSSTIVATTVITVITISSFSLIIIIISSSIYSSSSSSGSSSGSGSGTREKPGQRLAAARSDSWPSVPWGGAGPWPSRLLAACTLYIYNKYIVYSI